MASQETETNTLKIFNHHAVDIAPRISQKWFLDGQKPHEAVEGQSAIINILSSSRMSSYRIMLVQAYSASTPGRNWGGKRLEEIQALPPSFIIAYGTRGGILPFIVAAGGDNLEMHSIQEMESGKVLKTPTEIAGILGLRHGGLGRLVATEDRTFDYKHIA